MLYVGRGGTVAHTTWGNSVGVYFRRIKSNITSMPSLKTRTSEPSLPTPADKTLGFQCRRRAAELSPRAGVSHISKNLRDVMVELPAAPLVMHQFAFLGLGRSG